MADGKFKEEALALHKILQDIKQKREKKIKRDADNFKASQIAKSSNRKKLGQL